MNNQYVAVANPGQDDEAVVDEFPTAAEGYKFVRANPGTDLMKRLPDGTFTTEF